jgi:hypothetical protein
MKQEAPQQRRSRMGIPDIHAREHVNYGDDRVKLNSASRRRPREQSGWCGFHGRGFDQFRANDAAFCSFT